MRRVLVAAVVLLVLATACGDGTKRLTTGDEPAATGCTADEDDPTDYNSAEGQAVGARQAELRGDMERLQAYGRAHPDEFTSVAFDNYPSVKTVAYFTGSLEQHESAIKEQLKFPNQFEIRQSVQSDRAAQQIMDRLNDDARTRTDGTGFGPRANGVIFVSLGTSQGARDLAQELVDTYAERVCVDLGGHPFPKGALPDTTKCPTEPLATDRVESIEAKVVLTKTTLERGERGEGVLRITNRGTTPLDTESGTSIRAVVLLPGTDDIVGVSTGFSTAAAMIVRVAPGETKEFPLSYGTSDCRPDSDYSLPPGDYVVSTHLDKVGRSDDVTITIVE